LDRKAEHAIYTGSAEESVLNSLQTPSRKRLQRLDFHLRTFSLSFAPENQPLELFVNAASTTALRLIRAPEELQAKQS
jgi:phage baseplate assembly protein W